MLLRAAKEHNLDLNLSIMVGDKGSDLEAGRAAGCRTGLVRTGYGAEMEGSLPADSYDEIFDSLADAGPYLQTYFTGLSK